MGTTVRSLTLETVDQLPKHARRCVYWELDPAVAATTKDFTDPAFEKEVWLSTVMLQWGLCGQIGMINGQPAGCAIYAPPGMVPRAAHFPTSPVSADAVLLTTLWVEPSIFRNTRDEDEALAQQMISAVVADLVRRGVRALEAFGYRTIPDAASPDQAGSASDAAGTRRRYSLTSSFGAGECNSTTCMISAEFLEDVGFEVVAPHHRFPRLRLELDADHGWKADVEAALEQLLVSAALTMNSVKTPVGAGALRGR